MARADFYLIAKERFREEPLLLVCELAKKAYAANLPMLVLARDTAQAEALDDLLDPMAEAVECWLVDGMEAAMNRFNAART